jgi:hypothetical protein
MGMQIAPDHVDNRGTDLEDHPAVGVGIQRSQRSERGAEVPGDSDHLSVEKGHAFADAEFLAVQAKAIADFFGDFLIDVSFAHQEPPAN